MSREEALYRLWREKTARDAQAQSELAQIENNTEEITDRFYRELSFGTAGLRGVLGLGTNRMNLYTVGRAAQGLARYVCGSGAKDPSAAIAYDSRNYSWEFARHTACVFAANGVRVHLYRELMPTPALSYAVRELGCDTGVVITASHNPAVYNGFKAYGPDGCQIGPEQAGAVQRFIGETDPFEGVAFEDFDKAMANGMIQYIPESFVQQYLDRVRQESLEPEVAAKSGLSIVYTPLNGAGNRSVRSVLARMGLESVAVVPEQENPDGNFPTCPSPNPELRPALELGLEMCRRTRADLLIATDPDADRMAAAVRQDGDYRILTGNETGVLLLDYICKTRVKMGKMPPLAVAIRSLVSTPLADAVASGYGVEMRSVPTGFKFIGETIAELESQGAVERFIFAFEESCGYLSGGYVRDKDAVNASLLLAEAAGAYKLQGKTLADALEEIYKRHGVYLSAVDNFVFEGAQGMRQMERIMERLRSGPPAAIAGDAVVRVADYAAGEEIVSGVRANAALPVADMIELHLKSGSSVIVRPSGTEPKIKAYYTVTAKDHTQAESAARRLRDACKRLIR